MLHNQSRHPDHAFQKGKTSQGALFTQAYAESKNDLMVNLRRLGGIFKANDGKWDFPVAFATNSMYLMARHQIICQDTFTKILVPVVKAKRDLLHAEGLAHFAWGLSRAELWDSEAWAIVKEEALSKQFEYTVVKHKPWFSNQYVEATKQDHLLQGSASDFYQEYFFREGAQLYELHDALVYANELNAELGLKEIIKELESRHMKLRANREIFLKLHKHNNAFDYNVQIEKLQLV
jgi:hypothetical protein